MLRSHDVNNYLHQVVYDFKAAVEPFLNETIKWYQIPFVFMFGRVDGIAVMWYKLFSTHKEWLPERPDTRDIENGSMLLVNRIVMQPFGFVGGKKNYMESKIDEAPESNDVPLTEATADDLQLASDVMRSLDNVVAMEEEIANDMVRRLGFEADGIFGLQKRMQLPPSQRNKDHLTRQNNGSRGYIVWLQDVVDEDGQRSWRDMIPMPIIPNHEDSSTRSSAGEINSCAKKVIDNVSNMIYFLCNCLMIFLLMLVGQ